MEVSYMDSNELARAKETLETKFKGNGSTRFSHMPALVVSLSLRVIFSVTWLYLIPNIMKKILALGGIDLPLFKWMIINLGISELMIILIPIIAALFFLYREFIVIELSSNSVRELKVKFKDNPLVIETMTRWVDKKGFINYTDKRDLRNYYDICHKQATGKV